MIGFFRNFWACLGIALFCSWYAADAYTDGSTGWAWIMGIVALFWLNDARIAKNRDAEEGEDESE